MTRLCCHRRLFSDQVVRLFRAIFRQAGIIIITSKRLNAFLHKPLMFESIWNDATQTAEVLYNAIHHQIPGRELIHQHF